MNWRNLKNYKCPQCRWYLHENPKLHIHFCSNKICNFQITSDELNDMVLRMFGRPRVCPECQFEGGYHVRSCSNYK